MISPSDLFHPSAAPHFKTFQVFILLYVYVKIKVEGSRSQWPRGLRCWSAAARQLRSWVRIPPGAWMFVCCECRVLSGRGLCDELITCPEESYRLWCVVVCDLETSRIGAPYIYGISCLRVNLILYYISSNLQHKKANILVLRKVLRSYSISRNYFHEMEYSNMTN